MLRLGRPGICGEGKVEHLVRGGVVHYPCQGNDLFLSPDEIAGLQFDVKGNGRIRGLVVQRIVAVLLDLGPAK